MRAPAKSDSATVSPRGEADDHNEKLQIVHNRVLSDPFKATTNDFHISSAYDPYSPQPIALGENGTPIFPVDPKDIGTYFDGNYKAASLSYGNQGMNVDSGVGRGSGTHTPAAFSQGSAEHFPFGGGRGRQISNHFSASFDGLGIAPGNPGTLMHGSQGSIATFPNFSLHSNSFHLSTPNGADQLPAIHHQVATPFGNSAYAGIAAGSQYHTPADMPPIESTYHASPHTPAWSAAATPVMSSTIFTGMATDMPMPTYGSFDSSAGSAATEHEGDYAHAGAEGTGLLEQESDEDEDEDDEASDFVNFHEA